MERVVGKRRAAPVRQLSLQQADNGRRPPLRKQHSEDGGLALSVTANSITAAPQQQLQAAPRPPKLAWTDRHPAPSSPVGAVIAQRVTGQPRPQTGGGGRRLLPALALQDSLLFSRQQLAERLRRAWREREARRPNLDIFLAHAQEEDRPGSASPTMFSVGGVAKNLSPRTPESRSGSNSPSFGCRNIGTPDCQSPAGGNSPLLLARSIKQSESVTNSPIRSGRNFRVSVVTDLQTSSGRSSPLIVNRKGTKTPDSQSPYGCGSPLILTRNKSNNAKNANKVNPLPPQSIVNEENQANTPSQEFQNSLSINLSDNMYDKDSESELPLPEDEMTQNQKLESDAEQTISIEEKVNESSEDLRSEIIDDSNKDQECQTKNCNETPLTDHSSLSSSAVNIPEKYMQEITERLMLVEKQVLDDKQKEIGARSLGLVLERNTQDTTPANQTNNDSPKLVISVPLTKEDQKRPMTAASKRVNFRNSGHQGKVVEGSVSQQQQPLARTLSAPAHRPAGTQPSGAPAVRPISQPPPRSILVRKAPLQPSASFDNGASDSAEAPERNIRSAPPRRRFKVPKRRTKERGEESSDEEAAVAEAEKKPVRGNSASGGRRGVSRGSVDVVTMVSLLSPTGSDTEVDPPEAFVAPPPNWLEERVIRAISSNSKSSSDEPAEPPPARVVCLRKTPKSVSFQPQAMAPLRALSAGLTARRGSVAAGLAAAVLAAACPAAPGSTTEKRAPVPSTPLADAKRRLIRTKSSPAPRPAETLASESESSAEDEVEVKKGVGQQTAVPQQQVLPVPATNDDNSEPEFHTDKERECWRLYRKMCEKGVSVSYDTVLRGMLTPTEYRMRRSALMSSC